MPQLSHPRPEFPPPISYGALRLESRYHLSPLAGYTNLSFRRIVRQIGGIGLATTDLVSADAILHENPKTLKMIETHPEDRPFAVQIFGRDAATMVDAAQVLEARGIDSIDINMGCPVAKIAGGGSGAGMMCNTDGTTSLVQKIVEAVRIPISVKMRLGWDSTQLTAPMFAREFEQIGVVAIAIHGRTREQGFSGTVDLNGIRKVAEATESIPVIGNGDVRTIADAARMLTETGCDGVSIGRGALANPWIFRQLSQWEQTGEWSPPGSFNDRLELLLRQFSYMEEQWGPEAAIVRFRKMSHWYLKSMRVRPALRHHFQQAKTREAFDAAIATIVEDGPVGGNRTGLLPDMHVPVPSGPVERW
jgi:tRNA-dihydrouridine synthase B